MEKKTRTTIVPLKILFRIYAKHKEDLTSLRMWVMARCVLDECSAGWVSFRRLCRAMKFTPRYAKRNLRKTLFRGLFGDKLYYRSALDVINNYELNEYKDKIRGEYTSKLRQSLKSKKKFVAYITKCYLEKDLRGGQLRYLTHGRISLYTIMNYFLISKNTAISNIRISRAKFENNIKDLRHIAKFDSRREFGQWLAPNMDLKIYNKTIEQNPRSYFVKYDSEIKKFVLCKRDPHIYWFTGIFLARAKY